MHVKNITNFIGPGDEQVEHGEERSFLLHPSRGRDGRPAERLPPHGGADVRAHEQRHARPYPPPLGDKKKRARCFHCDDGVGHNLFITMLQKKTLFPSSLSPSVLGGVTLYMNSDTSEPTPHL